MQSLLTSSIFLFVNSFLVSPYSITFSFSAPLSISSNWSVISYNCSFSLVFHDEYCACIHVGTAPAFIHSCRCCLSFGCRLVVFLNQNPCTWSGPPAFQLYILDIAHFRSFAVMITFSCFDSQFCLSVSLSPSSTTQIHYSIVLHWFRP